MLPYIIMDLPIFDTPFTSLQNEIWSVIVSMGKEAFLFNKKLSFLEPKEKQGLLMATVTSN